MSDLETPPGPVPERPELSVLVAVEDEEDNVLAVTAELVEALEGRVAYEVVYVDDGSTDATPERLAEAARRWPAVRVVAHRHNRGKSAALVTAAEAARGAWVATMDGDGQNDPRDLLALFEEARRRGGDGALVVCGRRRRRRDTLLKRLSSRVANAVRGRLLRDHTPDAGCGMKVMRRDLFLALPRFDNMHRFLPALVLREGGETVSLPVADRPRAAGRSKYGFHNRLWVGLGDLVGMIWLQRRAFPPHRAGERGPRDG